MSFCQLEKVSIRGPRCMMAPLREVTCPPVVDQKTMTDSQGSHHACQRFARLFHRHESFRALDRNPHEAEFWDRRHQQDRGLLLSDGGDPSHSPLMLDVIGPTPSDEDIDIQEVFHGKSERSSRTDSVVSGGYQRATSIKTPPEHGI